MNAVRSDYGNSKLGAVVAVLIIIAAVYALFSPTEALRVLVVAGGLLLAVDGALGLATQWRAGGGATGRIVLVRDALSVVAGLLILAGIFWNWFEALFMVRLVGFLLLLTGLADLATAVVGGSRRSGLVAILVSALAYIIAGLALIFAQVSSALVIMKLLAVVALVYAAFKLYGAWRAYGASAIR